MQVPLDICDHGWSVPENSKDGVPMPVWDTLENMAKVDIRRQAIMQKCECKKSGCNPSKNYCKCVKNNRVCTMLCKCVGCKNVEQHPGNPSSSSDEDSHSDSVSSSSSVSSLERHLLYDVPLLGFGLEEEGLDV